jgi:hypothetical protein
MHEIALHHNHDGDDFIPPCMNEDQRDLQASKTDFVTPAHIDSLTKCLSSIHLAFDGFIATDTYMLRVLPVMVYVRVTYAAVVLLKMSSMVGVGSSRFGSVFDDADLRVDYYINAMLATFSQVSRGERSSVASLFILKFQELRCSHALLRASNHSSSLRPSRKLTMRSSSGPSTFNGIQSFTATSSSMSGSSRGEIQGMGGDFDQFKAQDTLFDAQIRGFDVDAMLLQMEGDDWFNYGMGFNGWGC